jgi:multidrug efflux pump subunit AcrA (membrane-fusion protein)
VEITVEKIPNALHIPAQAVFERDGKPVVFVKGPRGFEPHPIQIAKRSESTMVLTGGVKAGELIALSDPIPRRGGKASKQEKKSGGNPMGALPGGGGGR